MYIRCPNFDQQASANPRTLMKPTKPTVPVEKPVARFESEDAIIIQILK